MVPIYLSVSPFGADRLAEAARIARAAGCVAADVSSALLPDGRCPAALEGLPVAVVSVSWQLQRRPNLAAWLDVARHLGAETLNVYASLGAGDEAEEAREALLRDIRACLAARGEHGPGLTLENALEPPSGLAATFDAWLGILKAVDSPDFRGTLDAANFVACGDGGSLGRVAGGAAPWIGYVHAKGVVPFDEGLSRREPFRRVWQGAGRWLAAPAGEGSPDYRELLGGLFRAGYRGAVCIEPFDQEAPVRSAAAFLRDVIESTLPPGDGP